MRSPDVTQLEKFLGERKERFGDVRNVILCTGDSSEVQALVKTFPGVNVTNVTKNQWDIQERPYPRDIDMVLACNVFMCSKDPLTWFKNGAASARHLVIMDHCVAWRGGTEELGKPEDQKRFTYPPLMVAKHEEAFDLHSVGDALLEVEPYNYPSGCGVQGFEDVLMFIAHIRGGK